MYKWGTGYRSELCAFSARLFVNFIIATVLIVAINEKAASAAPAVTITFPTNGATVSGNVTIRMTLASNVWWTWLFIDGHPGPSGYNPLIWNSSTVSAGTHILRVNAYPRGSSTVLGSSTISVTVRSVPTATSTPTPTSTATATPTSIATATPTSIATATPTSIATATPTSIATATPTSIATATPTSTATATPTGISYYVDSTLGSDSNNGLSSSSPWKTLTKVNATLSSLKPGNSILFARGSTFVASSSGAMITLPHPLNGAAGKPITFGSYGSGNKPIFNGNHTSIACFDACAASSDGGCVPSGGVPLWSYITINGLECDNTTEIGIGFKQQASSSPVPMPGIVIENNTVNHTGSHPDPGTYDNQVELLEYAYTADGIKMLSNDIRNPGGHNGLQIHGDTGSPLAQFNTCVGPWEHNCIDIKETRGAVVDSNVAYEPASSGTVAGEAFNYQATQVSPNDVTFTRNVAYGPMTGAALVCNWGATFDGPTCVRGNCNTTCNIYNNTLNSTAGAAFATDFACVPAGQEHTTIDIRNNILDAIRAIYVRAACGSNTSITWDYNDDCATRSTGGVSCWLWPNGVSYSTLSSFQAGTGQGTHDLFAVNPDYVDFAAGDLRLLSSSPLIGKGLPNLVPGMSDIGAY
jgi:hypothetical protein